MMPYRLLTFHTHRYLFPRTHAYRSFHASIYIPMTTTDYNYYLLEVPRYPDSLHALTIFSIVNFFKLLDNCQPRKHQHRAPISPRARQTIDLVRIPDEELSPRSRRPIQEVMILTLNSSGCLERTVKTPVNGSSPGCHRPIYLSEC